MNGLKIKNKISDREIYNRHKKVMRESSANYMFYKDFIKNGNMYNGVLEEEYEKDRPVAIVHTGGTTGVPKGVLLSNDNLNELTNQIKNSPVQFIRHYLLVGVMPEFVGYGLSVGLHTSLVCGMKTMMIAKYEPEKIPEVILKYKPNCMAGSPAHWEIFSKSPLINRPNVDLSFFKAPIEGGDTLNAKVESKVNEILDKGGCEYKIQKGYGLTEKCSAVTVCFNNEVNKPGSVGVPFSKTVVSIYDNDKEEDLHYNELGDEEAMNSCLVSQMIEIRDILRRLNKQYELLNSKEDNNDKTNDASVISHYTPDRKTLFVFLPLSDGNYSIVDDQQEIFKTFKKAMSSVAKGLYAPSVTGFDLYIGSQGEKSVKVTPDRDIPGYRDEIDPHRYKHGTARITYDRIPISASNQEKIKEAYGVEKADVLLIIECSTKMNDSSKGTYNAVNRRIAKEIGNIRYVFNLFSTDFDDASFKAATELIDDSDKYCERLYKDPFKKLDDESLWR